MSDKNENFLNDKILVFSLSNKKDEVSHKIGEDNDEEEYALNIGQVREIINYDSNITRMPGRPNYIVGIKNIRGETVSIMDLGYRLNYEVDYKQAKIVIAYVHGEKVGLIVQSVKDVLFIDENECEAAPYREGIDFVKGIIKKYEYDSDDIDSRKVKKTRVITILDADKIIKEEDTKYELVD
ncbi:MAG: purine-binding chemotaxis protein CheW [Romboutsia sp.]|nr:purine-binding chemotaxis protein CheW [Romboutsia sp.]